MTIEKFEVGKKYRFLENGDREDVYCGCDVVVGQEFRVHYIINGWVNSEDVTYRGKVGCWSICKDEVTTNIELVEEEEETPQIVPDNNVDAIETQTEPTTLTGKESTLEALREANTPVNVCPLWAMKQLCSENDINIEVQNCGDIYIHLAHSDESYKVKDMKELTSVLDAVKLLESFKEE